MCQPTSEDMKLYIIISEHPEIKTNRKCRLLLFSILLSIIDSSSCSLFSRKKDNNKDSNRGLENWDIAWRLYFRSYYITSNESTLTRSAHVRAVSVQIRLSGVQIFRCKHWGMRLVINLFSRVELFNFLILFFSRARNVGVYQPIRNKSLKQNEAQSAHAESTHKGVNQRSKVDRHTNTTTKTRVAYGNSHLECV